MGQRRYRFNAMRGRLLIALVLLTAGAGVHVGSRGGGTVHVPERFGSAETLAATLNQLGFPCDFLQPRSGWFSGDVGVCDRYPDPGRTGGPTIHVFADPADLPDPAELGARPSSGPIVYWVLGENWFVATDSRPSALAIGRLLRSDVYAPGEELLLSGDHV